MIQIIVCSCAKSKFYENIKDVNVVPCPRHLLFKERFTNVNVNISCKCLSLKRGRCNNCKTRCFTLNFIADKIKIFSLLDVPSDVHLKKIDDYLENDIKSMISFNFCYNCIKVYCSLDDPKEFDEIKGKQVFGEIKFFFNKKCLKF